MSGHSKWSTIKHKKAAADAKRGASFTKLANLIAVAARAGADPDTNFKLRLAINKAREANMPNSNVERAIKKGSGQLGGDQIEEITYEGMGPGGVAIMIDVATDNKNRTQPEVKTILSKHGGRMADVGSVAYQFDYKGVIRFKADDVEAATLDAIEAGAEDLDDDEGQLTVYTDPKQLDAARRALSSVGYDISSAALEHVPQNTIEISDEKTARQVIKIMDLLEEHDDVSNTFTNFDIDDDVATQLSE